MRQADPTQIALSRAILLVLTVFLAATLGACSGPSLAERGDTNLQKGNYELAASNYKAALDKDPDDEDLRRKYERAADLAVEANMEEARLALAEGAYEDAIYSAERALQWGPRRRDVARFASGIEERVASEVKRRSEAGMYASAFELATLGLNHLTSDYVGAIESARNTTLALWVDWLLQEAEAAAAREALATQAIFLTEAARVSRDAGLAGGASRALESVRAAHPYTFAVSSGRNRGAEILAQLPETIGTARVVNGRMSGADFSVEVSLTDVDIYDDIVTETRTKRYVAGHRDRKNPEWIHIRRDVEHIEHQLEDAELELIDAKHIYRESPRPRNKARLEATEDKVDLLEDRLRDRKHDLFRADEYIKEDVMGVHHWDVQTVTRVAEGRVTLRWRDPADGREVVTTEPLRLVERDSSHQGYSKAGIDHDPLVLSSVEEMGNQLARDGAAQVLTLLDENWHSHVNEVAARAEQEHDATEGVALRVILHQGMEAGDVDRLVQLTGVEPEVAAQLVEL